MSSSKKYGLILSDKSKPSFQASRNVFGNDSDSDDDSGKNKKPVLLRLRHNINRQISGFGFARYSVSGPTTVCFIPNEDVCKSTHYNNSVSADKTFKPMCRPTESLVYRGSLDMAKVTQEKAIMEDPTVYQYDELYDSMTSKKEDEKSKSKEEKKPKYIENLLKSANKRKIENERRVERQIQKERENEGDEFADKEVFVTSAYKKKLEEIHLEEEKERREEYLEKIGDVTKQRDLGGFYRYLYEQKLGSDKILNEKEKQDTTEVAETSKTGVKDEKKEFEKVDSKKRNYRKRKSSSEVKKLLSEGEIEDSDDEINRVNLTDIQLAKRCKKDDPNIDADSDFSIDESSEDEATDKDNTKQSPEQIKTKSEKVDITTESVEKSDTVDKDLKYEKEEKEMKKTEEFEPKIDIWKKRTIGELFEQALKRYYERKAARGI